MKILIVVDANIIISALLGGKPSIILFDGRFQFVTTHFTISEVRKYFSYFQKQIGISERELGSLLNKIPLGVYKRDFYQDKIKEADSLIGHIDKKDIEVLALALKLEAYLWSQDRHFEKANYSKLLKTYNFL